MVWSIFRFPTDIFELVLADILPLLIAIITYFFTGKKQKIWKKLIIAIAVFVVASFILRFLLVILTFPKEAF